MTSQPATANALAPLLSVQEVRLRYPGLSVRATRSLMRDVGAVEVGRKLFVRLDDLLAFEVAQARRCPVSDEAPQPEQVLPRGYWIRTGS